MAKVVGAFAKVKTVEQQLHTCLEEPFTAAVDRFCKELLRARWSITPAHLQLAELAIRQELVLLHCEDAVSQSAINQEDYMTNEQFRLLCERNGQTLCHIIARANGGADQPEGWGI